MKTYTSYSTLETPQNESLPGQTQNSAGGYSWKIDKWKQLDRFLILGTEGGTYYIGEKKLTRDNAKSIEMCIAEGGERTVNRIKEISVNGRAYKNDPAIFALAMCASLGDTKTKSLALEAVPSVCRIGTHLFHFMAYVEQFRGWGRGLRRAVGNWYTGKSPEDLAYQVIKYQSRDGWSHFDALRLSHPKDEKLNPIFAWVTGKDRDKERLPNAIIGFEKLQKCVNPKDASALIREYGLPRECVPTELLNYTETWEALIEKMPMTAMIRNLATMTRVGLIKPLSIANNTIVSMLSDEVALKKSRIHPIQILAAQITYAQGHGMRGQNEWTPVPQIIDALDGAFYKTFQNIEPANKPVLYAIDVSGSMGGGEVSGVVGLTPRVASAALAMACVHTEPNYHIMGFSHQLVPLSISKGQRLDDVANYIGRIPMGGTDCALPMVWALQNDINVESFVVLTDSETWFGSIHPAQALIQYRKKINQNAKLVVVGMTADEFSIADPNDAGMIDIVGFDTETPKLITDFSSGRI